MRKVLFTVAGVASLLASSAHAQVKMQQCQWGLFFSAKGTEQKAIDSDMINSGVQTDQGVLLFGQVTQFRDDVKSISRQGLTASCADFREFHAHLTLPKGKKLSFPGVSLFGTLNSSLDHVSGDRNAKGVYSEYAQFQGQPDSARIALTGPDGTTQSTATASTLYGGAEAKANVKVGAAFGSLAIRPYVALQGFGTQRVLNGGIQFNEDGNPIGSQTGSGPVNTAASTVNYNGSIEGGLLAIGHAPGVGEVLFTVGGFRDQEHTILFSGDAKQVGRNSGVRASVRSHVGEADASTKCGDFMMTDPGYNNYPLAYKSCQKQLRLSAEPVSGLGLELALNKSDATLKDMDGFKHKMVTQQAQVSVRVNPSVAHSVVMPGARVIARTAKRVYIDQVLNYDCKSTEVHNHVNRILDLKAQGMSEQAIQEIAVLEKLNVPQHCDYLFAEVEKEREAHKARVVSSSNISPAVNMSFFEKEIHQPTSAIVRVDSGDIQSLQSDIVCGDADTYAKVDRIRKLRAQHRITAAKKLEAELGKPECLAEARMTAAPAIEHTGSNSAL